MGFLLCCDNKGCFETTEALLDPKTNEVYCGACGKTITNVTQFAKIQMKSMGQTLKNTKAKKAFSVTCQFCGKTDQPIVNRDGAIICSLCKTDVTATLSPPMAQAIRMSLSGQL